MAEFFWELLGFLNNPRRRRPSANAFKSIIRESTSVFEAEPSVLDLEGRFVVVGDLHGDITSLKRIFNQEQFPPQKRFLFLGDYVDRGESSCEVLMLLLSLKILFPKDVYMIRGNHETRDQTCFYGFRDECLSKYDETVYDMIIEMFTKLPLAAVVNNTAFCVHGGISSELKRREDLRKIEKAGPILCGGVTTDILWSDFGIYIDGVTANTDRGCGYLFGKDYTKKWLQDCGFKYVIRSHQACELGYNWVFGEDVGCLTVFSAVDYLEQANDGAVAHLDSDSLTVSLVSAALPARNVLLLYPKWAMVSDGPIGVQRMLRQDSEPICREPANGVVITA